MTNTENEGSWVGVVLFIIMLLFIAGVVIAVVFGLRASSEKEGYCDALSAEYVRDGDAGEAYCIKDGEVVKEWK